MSFVECRSHAPGSAWPNHLWAVVFLVFFAPVVPACTDPGGPGLACVSDDRCRSGERCIEGRCRPASDPKSCARDEDCAAGESCDPSEHTCKAKPPGCASDSSCAPNQRCHIGTGVCEIGPRTCFEDSSCRSIGQRCDLQRELCVECLTTLDCPDPKVCINGDCVTPDNRACLVDASCRPPLLVCEGRLCVPGCGASGSPITCGAGTRCDTSTGRCAELPPPCSDDAACNPPSKICMDSVCVPGCGVEGEDECQEGTTCNESTGRCAPVPARAPLNGVCEEDSDCASKVCFAFGGNVGRRCVESCGKPSDCPESFTCYDLHGGKMCLSTELFEDATFGKTTGSYCASGVECKSNFCPNAPGLCVDTCTANADCGSSLVCRWFEYARDAYVSACVGGTQGRAGGASCEDGSECQSGVCYGNGLCGDLCESSRDCPSATVCAPVDYSVCITPGAPCLEWQVNLVRACLVASVGTRAIGEACTVPSQCRDGFCDTDLGQCTGTCARNDNCPADFVCGVEETGVLGDGSRLFGNFCMPRT